MAPSSDDNIYKAYFDDPTLSDLSIRLSDRTVHVHRIVLCRRSVYFEKLILGSFKESGEKEIELHEDDPQAMMALFRYIYDIPYRGFIENYAEELQFHAKVYVVAEKYQVQGLHAKATKTMNSLLWNGTNYSLLTTEENDANDFFGAVRIIFTETSAEDNMCRAALVEFAVSHINDLKQLPAFSELLKHHGDLAVEMFAHERLGFMLEGTWLCDGDVDRRAVPHCPECKKVFPNSKLRECRGNRLWSCSYCGQRVLPVCSRHSGIPQRVEWKWD